MEKGKKQDSSVEELLARLTQQQEVLNRQKQQLDENEGPQQSSSPTDPFAASPITESVDNADGRPDAAEVYLLKKQLALAQERMAMMDLELTQSRITKHTVEEAIGSPFPAAQHLAYNLSGVEALSNRGGLQGMNSSAHPIGYLSTSSREGVRVDSGFSSGSGVYTSML